MLKQIDYFDDSLLQGSSQALVGYIWVTFRYPSKKFTLVISAAPTNQF